DPLRDEGAAYADRLRAAGVAVTYLPGPGLVHGYFAFLGVVEAADRRAGPVLVALDDLLGSSPREDDQAVEADAPSRSAAAACPWELPQMNAAATKTISPNRTTRAR